MVFSYLCVKENQKRNSHSLGQPQGIAPTTKPMM